MRQKISVLFLLVTSFSNLNAQVFPCEGDQLNYRLVGLSFPPEKNAKEYIIEIAIGCHTRWDSFEHNIISTIHSGKNKIIVDIPGFGNKYTWRVLYPAANKTTKTVKSTILHHFSVGSIPAVDTDLYRLRVLQPAKEYKDAFVFVDATGVLYDMQGRPVWFLPETFRAGNAQIRDLKLSPFGTITFISGSRIYEVDYNGNVLWKMPRTDTSNKKLDTVNNLYHHEFTRLASGHYMVMGSEDLVCKLPDSKDSSYRTVRYLYQWVMNATKCSL